MWNSTGIILTMNNYQSYKSKLTKTLNFLMRVNFILVYSPDLASTELYFVFIQKRL